MGLSSGQVKPKIIGIFNWFHLRSTCNTNEKAQILGCLRIRIICRSETTCLPTDCCFIDLALWKSNKACQVGLVQNGNCYLLIEYNLFSPWYSWKRAPQSDGIMMRSMSTMKVELVHIKSKCGHSILLDTVNWCILYMCLVLIFQVFNMPSKLCEIY